MSNLLFFGVAPYVAVALFIVVALWRYFVTPYKFSSLSSEFLESRELFWGSVPWHYGIMVLFFGHLIGFLCPAHVAVWNSVPLRLLILEVTALVFGLLCLVGLLFLIKRRITNPRVRVVTSWMDMVVLVLLLVQVVDGLWIAITLRWGSAWYVATMVPYLKSVLMFSPQVELMAGMATIIKVHVFGAILTVAILPFTRLVHFLVPPISYLWRPSQVVIWNWDRKKIREVK